jgi:hypothetical protein
MSVYRRLVCACSSCARDCASCACAWSTRRARRARRHRVVAFGLGNERCAIHLEARFAWRSASSAVTVRRVTLARAAMTLASACTTARRTATGSILAIFSPFFTGELKSAYSSWMRPDTWLPTSTVTTACRLPEVLTRETTLPRSRRTVWYSGAIGHRPCIDRGKSDDERR